jgi:hypothetical protein
MSNDMNYPPPPPQIPQMELQDLIDHFHGFPSKPMARVLNDAGLACGGKRREKLQRFRNYMEDWSRWGYPVISALLVKYF